MSKSGIVFTLSKMKFFKKRYMSKILLPLEKCVLVYKVARCTFLTKTGLYSEIIFVLLLVNDSDHSYQLKMMFSSIKPLFLKCTNNETPCIRRLNMYFRYATTDNLRELSNFPEP